MTTIESISRQNDILIHEINQTPGMILWFTTHKGGIHRVSIISSEKDKVFDVFDYKDKKELNLILNTIKNTIEAIKK